MTSHGIADRKLWPAIETRRKPIDLKDHWRLKKQLLDCRARFGLVL